MGQKDSKQAAEDSSTAQGRPKLRRKFLPPNRSQVDRGERSGGGRPLEGTANAPGHDIPLPLHLEGGRPRYRPLDRSKGEIRLLRILPPTKSLQRPKALDFYPEIVRCQLEYESLDQLEVASKEVAAAQVESDLLLDVLFQNVPELESDKDGRISAALKQTMRDDMQRKVEEKLNFEIGRRRKQMLKAYFAAFGERQQTWLPPEFESHTSLHKWESWLQTWIWSPLSGDVRHPEKDTIGYLALSYMWSDARPVKDFNKELAEFVKYDQAGGVPYAEAVRSVGLESKLEKPRTSQIFLDGDLIQVPRNLEKALRSLRETPEVQCGKRVWADNICINQQDLAERAHEIKKMGRIYRTADRVVSWLGDEADCSGNVLEIMNIIGQSIATEEDMMNVSQWFMRNICSEFALRLAQLLSRPYWTRIWIMQEIVLGNDKAITICGARRFPTAKLLTFGSRITTNPSSLLFNDTFNLAQDRTNNQKAVSPMELSKGLMKLRDLRQLQVNLDLITTQSCTTSTFWFRTASSNGATDPRDVVYGMLSILPKNFVALLNVDYSETHTYRDVMIDFAEANFRCNQSLSWILYRPWSPFPGYKDWPSWVPNLGLQFSLAHFNWTLRSDCNSGIPSTPLYEVIRRDEKLAFDALAVNAFYIDTVREATSSIASERRARNEQLLVNPHIFDEVIRLTGMPREVLRLHIQSVVLHAFPDSPPAPSLKLGTLPQHVYGDRDGLKQALAQCFERMTIRMQRSGDTVFDISLDYLEDEVQYNDYSAHMLSPTIPVAALPTLKTLLATFGNIDLWGVRLRDLFASHQHRPGGTNVPEVVIFDRTPMLARLFTTCSGYVGAALCPLRMGDQIHIIPGCQMPVVLRPSERLTAQNQTAFELLGGVFIPGIMHGEIWQDLKRRQSLKRLFLV